MENNPCGPNDLPIKTVKIVDCGELTGDDKLTEETAEFLKEYAQKGLAKDSESDEEDEIGAGGHGHSHGGAPCHGH